jgi:hypothetical protein
MEIVDDQEQRTRDSLGDSRSHCPSNALRRQAFKATEVQVFPGARESHSKRLDQHPRQSHRVLVVLGQPNPTYRPVGMGRQVGQQGRLAVARWGNHQNQLPPQVILQDLHQPGPVELGAVEDRSGDGVPLEWL